MGALARAGALDERTVLGALGSDPDPAVRRRACDLAATLGPSSSLDDALRASLDDADPLVVEAACWALGERVPERAVVDDLAQGVDRVPLVLDDRQGGVDGTRQAGQLVVARSRSGGRPGEAAQLGDLAGQVVTDLDEGPERSLVVGLLADQERAEQAAGEAAEALGREATYADAVRWHVEPQAPRGRGLLRGPAGSQPEVQVREKVVERRVALTQRRVLIAVTGCAPGVGATTAAVAIAGYLARLGHRTALAEYGPPSRRWRQRRW